MALATARDVISPPVPFPDEWGRVVVILFLVVISILLVVSR